MVFTDRATIFSILQQATSSCEFTHVFERSTGIGSITQESFESIDVLALAHN